MASNLSGNHPHFQPYEGISDEDALRLHDFERLIYDDPGWLMAVLDGEVSSDEISADLEDDIEFATGWGAESYDFDEETEEYIFANSGLQDLLSQRKPDHSPEAKQANRDAVRKLRLRLFVRRVIELHEQDDSHKITPLNRLPDAPSGSGKNMDAAG